ncbi:MAG: hypothetical protein EA366_03275, partial [Spirulina sp. DLM2.Bin59]
RPVVGLVWGGGADGVEADYSPLHLRDLSPDLVAAVAGLLDPSLAVQRRAYRRLRDLPHPRVQKILRSLLPYGLFAQLCQIRVGENVAVSASGRAIAHHSPRGLIVQTLADQEILYRIPGPPMPCLLNAHGQTLIRIVGEQERSLELWQRGQRQPTPKIQGFKTLALAARGTIGAIAYDNGQVNRWHLPTGKITAILPPTRHSSLLTLALSADGQTLATAHTGQRVRIMPPSGRPYQLPIPAHHLALSADGQTLATAHPNQGIRLWDLVRGQPLGILRSAPPYPSPTIGTITTLAFTPNGRVLATVIQPNHGPSQIWFWDLHQGDCIQTLTAPGGPITQMVFAAQGHALLTAHSDQQLRLWAVP